MSIDLKIARAVEECLALMDAGPGALISEMEYVVKLQNDSGWTNDEIKTVQHWIKKALDQRDCHSQSDSTNRAR